MKILNKLKSFFLDPSIVKEYWETETHGPLPQFPVIVYDKSITHDFIFYDHVHCFYNEFLGDELNADEIIIDKTGRIFNFKQHQQGFNYPCISQKTMELEELKCILKLTKIAGNERYQKISSIEKIMLLLLEHREEHRR